MKTQTDDPQLARIRGLLDTAESLSEQGNGPAAETYRNKAIELMGRYGIDHAMAAAAKKDPNEKPIQVAITCPAPYTRDKQSLLADIAEGLGVKAIRIRGTNYSYVIGFESDVKQVELLFISLLLQAFGEMTKVKSEDVLPYYAWLSAAEKRSARAAYNRSWLSGFGTVVGKRLAEATARARNAYETEHATSTALVVVDRSARVELAYKELHPDARQSYRRLSGSGGGHGRAAGMRANIGTTGLGGHKRALTS